MKKHVKKPAPTIKINIPAYGFIYETTNLINGMMYIGKRKFYNNWRDYLGSGVDLMVAIKDCGVENFKMKILAIAADIVELNWLEYDEIKKRNAVESPLYYNKIDGGFGNPYEFIVDEKMQIIEIIRPKGINQSINNEEVIKLWNSNYNIKSIAEHMKCSTTAIRNILKEYNLFIPHRKEERDNKIIYLKQHKYSLSMIAEEIGCSTTNIKNVLKKNVLKPY